LEKISQRGKSMQTTKQVQRCGDFELPCSAEQVFPLFSPEGERGWIKTWNPRPVFPDSIVFARDTVFREGDGNEEAVWTIVDADWKTLRAEYVRIAAASHAAHIVVKVDSVAPSRSRVNVSYTVTAFGDRAAALLETFSEGGYSDKMQSWQSQIGAYLEACASR
jgi:hypothetical protein